MLSNQSKVLVFDIGSGLSVPTVRRTAEWIGRDSNAALVRINPRDPDIPAGIKQAYSLPFGSVESLQAIQESVSALS